MPCSRLLVMDRARPQQKAVEQVAVATGAHAADEQVAVQVGAGVVRAPPEEVAVHVAEQAPAETAVDVVGAISSTGPNGLACLRPSTWPNGLAWLRPSALVWVRLSVLGVPGAGAWPEREADVVKEVDVVMRMAGGGSCSGQSTGSSAVSR